MEIANHAFHAKLANICQDIQMGQDIAVILAAGLVMAQWLAIVSPVEIHNG